MLLKQVAVLAVCCSCSPETLLDWPESRVLLWSRLVREAHRHVHGEVGLTYAGAFFNPKPLVNDLYGKPKPRKLRQAVEKVLSWAENIRRMPDSGSHDSTRRIERRRKKGRQ